MAGIKIDFVADVASFLRGTRDAESALDDVADSLDDLAREAQTEGKDAGTALERGISAGARDASDSVQGVERTFRDMARDVEKQSKRVGDDLGDSVKRGARDAESATSEFKDEARSNFSEVASSFSGDMDSAADLVQGTLGGLAGSLTGPLGLALGGLGATAGLFYNAWRENTEKTKETVSAMYDDLLSSGAEYLSKEHLTEQVQAIYDVAQQGVIKAKELRDLANNADIPEPLLARALVGDPAARAELATEISARRLQINEALDDATAKGQNMAPALAPSIQALQDIEARVDGASGALTTAQANANAARAAIESIVAPTQGVASSAEDARSKFDGLGRQIESLPDPEVKLGVDSSELDAYLSKPRVMSVHLVARPGDPKPV